MLHETCKSALDAAHIKWEGLRLTLSSYRENESGKTDCEVDHFVIGDYQQMAQRAEELAADGFNVYRALTVYPKSLKRNQRGKLAQVKAVFGLVADIDADKGNAFEIFNLPLPPSLVTITSREPAVNQQVTYFFTKAITAQEAAPIAQALCQLVGDADFGTADVNHIWRVAGTLNHPKASKLKRGRPATPQRVDPDLKGTGEAVDPEALSKALARALGVEDLEKAFKSAGEAPNGTRTTNAPAGKEGAQEVQGAKRRQDVATNDDDVSGEAPTRGWMGSGFPTDAPDEIQHAEMRRVLDALHHCKGSTHRQWSMVVHALADFFRGDPAGESIAVGWANGDEVQELQYNGRIFPGATYPGLEGYQTDAAKQETMAHYRQAGQGYATVSVATLFYFAKEGGYVRGRKSYGLPDMPRVDRGELDAEARKVQQAGLEMPREQMALTRSAWFWQVQMHATGIDLLRFAFFIMGFVNSSDGIAYPSYEFISKGLGWEAESGKWFKRAANAALRLQKVGLLVRTKAKRRGAHGRQGPSFALTLPGGMTWDQAIEEYRSAYKGSAMLNEACPNSHSQKLFGHNLGVPTATDTCCSDKFGYVPTASEDGCSAKLETQNVPTATHSGCSSIIGEELGGERAYANDQRSNQLLDQGKGRQHRPDPQTPILGMDGEILPPPVNQTLPPTTLTGRRGLEVLPAISEQLGNGVPKTLQEKLVLLAERNLVPDDVAHLLQAAIEKRSSATFGQIVDQLHKLWQLGLSDAQILLKADDARTYVIGKLAEKLEEVQADDETLATDVCDDSAPSKFLTPYLKALMQRVTWASEDIREKKLQPQRLAMDAALQQVCEYRSALEQKAQSEANWTPEEREAREFINAWRAKGTDAFATGEYGAKSKFTYLDAAKLAEEFDEIFPQVRRALEENTKLMLGHSRSHLFDGEKSPAPSSEKVLERLRPPLLVAKFGPAAENLDGPVWKHQNFFAATSSYSAVGEQLVTGTFAGHEAGADDEVLRELANYIQTELHVSGSFSNRFDHKHPETGESIQLVASRYRNGLQEDVDALVVAKIRELVGSYPERLAKRKEFAEARARREAEEAKAAEERAKAIEDREVAANAEREARITLWSKHNPDRPTAPIALTLDLNKVWGSLDLWATEKRHPGFDASTFAKDLANAEFGERPAPTFESHFEVGGYRPQGGWG